jgi:hypothetical protein
MATIVQNSITFNVNSDTVFSKNGKYTHGSNTDGNKFDAEYFAENPNDLAKSFNAIEIDWNGAQLGSTTINTTGQLLSYITTLSNRIAALENGGGSSKPTATLLGVTDKSNAWYNTYYLLKVRVQKNSASWPVTVTNHDDTILIIDNTYYSYTSDVSDKPTRRLGTVQLDNFSDYVTIVHSGSGVPTSKKLTFSTAENSTYAATSFDLNFDFTKK